jgi:translation initiation factor IF-1
MSEKKEETKKPTPPPPPPLNDVLQKEKEPVMEVEGVVVEAVKGKFRVKIPSVKPGGTDLYVLGYLAGKLRKNFIKIVPGDKVKIEISPYDVTSGRIVFRLK